MPVLDELIDTDAREDQRAPRPSGLRVALGLLVLVGSGDLAGTVDQTTAAPVTYRMLPKLDHRLRE